MAVVEAEHLARYLPAADLAGIALMGRHLLISLDRHAVDFVYGSPAA
jgi:hypothetical protein